MLINLDQKTKEGEHKKRDTYESAFALYEGRAWTLSAFKSLIFSIKAPQGQELKILAP